MRGRERLARGHVNARVSGHGGVVDADGAAQGVQPPPAAPPHLHRPAHPPDGQGHRQGERLLYRSICQLWPYTEIYTLILFGGVNHHLARYFLRVPHSDSGGVSSASELVRAVRCSLYSAATQWVF